VGIPPRRGPFTLEGYPTRLIRLTDETDGPVRPLGMAYYPIINNHAGRAELQVLASLNDRLTLFTVYKASGAVVKGDPLPLNPNTGEYCYWSHDDPDSVYLLEGRHLLRYSLLSGTQVEVSAPAPITHPHSSADGQVHSFEMDGQAAVYRQGRITQYPTPGVFDECQVDKSGRWLGVRYTVQRNGQGHLDNDIVDLTTGQRWTILDEDGAMGHWDLGFGYGVGEDDQAQPGGVMRLWIFTPTGPQDGGPVYDWGGWQSMTRYVSHCNARPAAPHGQRVLFSSATLGLVIKTIGQDDAQAIAPSLFPGGEAYWRQTRATLDPTGHYGAWTGLERGDLFLAETP